MDCGRDTATPAGPCLIRQNHATVLIVDDDEDTRAMLVTWLACEGFAPVVARHGREALDLLLDGCRPQVILLDLMMPVVDGWTFLRQQQIHGDIAGVPVIVLSAVADPATHWPASVAAVIPKPCDFDLLSKSVQTISALFGGTVGTA